MFNSAQDCQINSDILNEIFSKITMTWMLFSYEKFKSAIDECNNSSTSELDYISWKHLKAVLKNEKCLNNFVKIANICIMLSY